MFQIYKTFFFSCSTILIAACLIAFPKESIEASLHGLEVWWKVVFPSLLPFFIVSELFVSFGIVHFLGVIFEPIMRPLFRVPGIGSFGWVMGMTSGYPIGTKIAVRLRKEGIVSQIEAERLIAFTNAASPLFIFGAISIGLYKDPKLGLLLAVCHYCANFLVGLCMRFYGVEKERQHHNKNRPKARFFNVVLAFKKMHSERTRQKKTIGEIGSDAVVQSIQTLFMIGGFIVFFSVVTNLLHLLKVSYLLTIPINILFYFLSIPKDFSLPIIYSLFEITIGLEQIALLSSQNFFLCIVLTSFALGFNGFSIHSQVASLIAKTDIRYLPYLLGRILHGLFAALLTVVLYKTLYMSKSHLHILHTANVHITNTFDLEQLYQSFITYSSLFTAISLCTYLIILIFKRKNTLSH